MMPRLAAASIQAVPLLDSMDFPVPGDVHVTESGIIIDPMFGETITITWEALTYILEHPEVHERLDLLSLE